MSEEPTVEGLEPVSPAPPTRLSLPQFSVRATYYLIAVNIAVFVLNTLLDDVLTQYGALVPGLVVLYLQWWRLITAGFLHANLVHIVFNLYALRGLGSLMERFFGASRLLIAYGLALLGSSALVTVFSPLAAPTVGASGAIMGVLGALVVFFWHYRDLLVGGRGYLSQLARMALINIGIGLLPGISWWGHLGGFLMGAAAGFLLIPRYERSGLLTPRLTLRRLEAKSWVGVGLLLMAELLLVAISVGWRG
ncbi:MAG: rhomboid family intramembrane serine protease [Anaerolineae bacterium]